MVAREVNPRRFQTETLLCLRFRGTKKDAEAELARLINKINTGEYVEPSKMLVRDYLDRWVLILMTDRSPSTKP